MKLINEFELLDGDLINEIIPILSKIIDLNTEELNEIYTEIAQARNELEWSKTKDSDLLVNFFNSFKESYGLGIDLPIWFNWGSLKEKAMIIGRDPQRNHDDNRLIIGTPFSVANKGGREAKNNQYWRFIKPLLSNNRIYITDVFKLFTKNPIDKKRLKQNKKLHYEILNEEIFKVDPNRIITIGKDAKLAILSIYQKELTEHNLEENTSYVKVSNDLEFFFVPHISNLVLQNFIPIANLFVSIGKLRKNKKWGQIGLTILNEKEKLFK